MKKIYIAHPLMGSTDKAVELGFGDTDENVERYLRYCAYASNNGDVVVSWVHHYLMHKRGLTTGDADFYLSRDKALLLTCDELWQAGPLEASSGLADEVRWAEEAGIPVTHRKIWDDPRCVPCSCGKGFDTNGDGDCPVCRYTEK